MRTTITLDPDTAAKVKAEMRRTGLTFKEVVNTLLRQASGQEKSTTKKPFKVKPFLSGERPGFDYDNIGELLEQIEGPFYK
jgi:hypothetical protein